MTVEEYLSPDEVDPARSKGCFVGTHRGYAGRRYRQDAEGRARSITSTAVYTALGPKRFKDFWRE
jgi:hypothetical protein